MISVDIVSFIENLGFADIRDRTANFSENIALHSMIPRNMNAEVRVKEQSNHKIKYTIIPKDDDAREVVENKLKYLTSSTHDKRYKLDIKIKPPNIGGFIFNF